MSDYETELLRRLVGSRIVDAQLYIESDESEIYSEGLQIESESTLSPFGGRFVFLKTRSDGQTPEVLGAPPKHLTSPHPDDPPNLKITDMNDASGWKGVLGELVESVSLIVFKDDPDTPTGIAIELNSGTVIYSVPNMHGFNKIVSKLDDAEFPSGVELVPVE